MVATSKYDHLLIYYFSGTGNAKKCAEWIAETGRTRNLDVYLINIDRFEEIVVPDIKGKALIGFCSPTHGFNLPPIMLKYISKFPKGKNADIFLLNTRAGMKLYKGFLPGLSGLAQFFPALIFLFKGYKIKGMQPIDLPSNWILIHPGLKKKVVSSLFKKHKRIVSSFADRLLDGKSKYQAFWSLPIDLLISPVALGYYFVGRFFLSKTLIATLDCDACQLCVKNCPVKAILWKKDRPYWTYRCESCMRCVNICPERAIETAHGLTAFVIYLSTILSSWVFSKYFIQNNLWGIVDHPWWSELLSFTLVSIIMILLVFGTYRLVHILLSTRFFHFIIKYTSLSSFKWWRRYRPKKNNVLRG